MSFSYNSSTWVPKSSIEHAIDILDNINTILLAKGVTPLLAALISNILWIFCLAVGAIRAVYDQLLYRAQNSLNIALCDDEQILNLLPIAGTSLIPGSYSMVTLTITASSIGTCVVPAGTRLAYIEGIIFETLTELTVSASATGTVEARATTIGSIEVPIGQLNSFIENITNLASVTNLSQAVVGRSLETFAQARIRINNGKVIDNNIDGLIRALRSLDGVTYANVFFNISDSVNLVLPGKTVLPRNAYVIIYGSSDLIALTYFERMTAETDGAQVQTYTTLAGQVLTMEYDYATSQDVYVKVYIPSGITLTDAQKAQIKLLITNYQSSVIPGQVITSNLIDGLLSTYTETEISDTDVSLNGTDWEVRVETNVNRYPLFTDANIEFENLT